MTRHCNGEDENLWMYVDPTTGKRPVDEAAVTESLIAKPCTCGRLFDDAQRSTIYPHRAL